MSEDYDSRCIMAVHDSMGILSGKWKISIIASVSYHGKRRFSDFLNDVPDISNKMLSQELKILEINKLLKRTILDTRPVAVQYELTEYGKSLKEIIGTLADWGMSHRGIISAK